MMDYLPRIEQESNGITNKEIKQPLVTLHDVITFITS